MKWSSNDRNTFIDLLSGIANKLHFPVSPYFIEIGGFMKGGTDYVHEIKKTGMVLYGGGGGVWEEMKRYRSISDWD